MIRRSFRIGLWLGLLAGIGFALAKIIRPKPEPSSVLDLGSPGASLGPSRADWPPLEAAVPTPAPIQVPAPEVTPVVAAAEPGLVTIGEEPLQEPEPAPAPPAAAPGTPPAPAPRPATPVPPAAAPVPPAAPKPVAKKVVAKKPAAKKAAAKKVAAPAEKVAVKKPAAKKLPPWVDPKGTICPKSHPVKGKLSSMIFQVPGNFAYERTTPDRCYKSVDEAEDDGLRAAKR